MLARIRLQNVSEVGALAEPAAQAGIGVAAVQFAPAPSPEALVGDRRRIGNPECVGLQSIGLNPGAMVMGGNGLSRHVGKPADEPARAEKAVLRAIGGGLEVVQIVAEADDLPKRAVCGEMLRELAHEMADDTRMGRPRRSAQVLAHKGVRVRNAQHRNARLSAGWNCRYR